MAALWFLWIAVLTAAHAESFYLESDPLATREAADAVALSASDAGCPGSVVRRYVRGAGWRYVFRSAAVVDPEVVRQCLDALGTDGPPFKLVEREGDRQRLIPSASQPDASPEVAEVEPVPVPVAARWTVEDVLSRVVRAHAGASTGANAEALLFRFVRMTAGGGRVEHVFAHRGDDLYLAVYVLEAEGTSSRAGIARGVPWLEGSTESLDVEHVRGTLERFAPSTVLGIAAELAAGRIELPDREHLFVREVGEGKREGYVELATSGDRVSAPMSLRIDTRTWRVLEYVRGPVGGAVRWTYEGWRETEDGALRPERVRVLRGTEVLDDVIVTELERSPTLPPEWFQPRVAPGG